MKLLLFLFFFCWTNAYCFSQTTEAEKLINLEQQWMNAMMQKDSATFDKIMHPAFLIQGIQELDRPAVGRAAWIDNTMHHLKVDSIHYSAIKVDVLENTAIVRSSFYWRAAFDGKDFSDSVYMVDLWIRKGNGWQVANRMVADNH